MLKRFRVELNRYNRVHSSKTHKNPLSLVGEGVFVLSRNCELVHQQVQLGFSVQIPKIFGVLHP